MKYRRNVGSLSIDMSADNRTITLGRHIDRHIGRVSVDRCSADVSVDMSTDTSRSTYRPTVDRYVGQYVDRYSTDMSTDTSVESRSICRSRGAQNTHDPINAGYVSTKKIHPSSRVVRLGGVPTLPPCKEVLK